MQVTWSRRRKTQNLHGCMEYSASPYRYRSVEGQGGKKAVMTDPVQGYLNQKQLPLPQTSSSCDQLVACCCCRGSPALVARQGARGQVRVHECMMRSSHDSARWTEACSLRWATKVLPFRQAHACCTSLRRKAEPLTQGSPLPSPALPCPHLPSPLDQGAGSSQVYEAYEQRRRNHAHMSTGISSHSGSWRGDELVRPSQPEEQVG